MKCFSKSTEIYDPQVKALLQACTQDVTSGGNWYYRISSRKMKSKEVNLKSCNTVYIMASTFALLAEFAWEVSFPPSSLHSGPSSM